MPRIAAVFAQVCVVASLVSGPAMAAGLHAPARKATARPTAPEASCLDSSRLVSHVAYLPVDPERTLRCGHLLSTDTMLTVHHWDRT